MKEPATQAPIEGVSMVYCFDDAKAAGRHTVQYYGMFGNRAIYADGWFADTIHKAPWKAKPRPALLDDKWELYDTRNDSSLATDLAGQNPAKLKELQDLFMKEAVKYSVLPIDDRFLERVNAKLAGWPDGGPHGPCAARRHEGDVGAYSAYDNEFTGKIPKATVDVKAMAAGEKGAASTAKAEGAARTERRERLLWARQGASPSTWPAGAPSSSEC